MSQTREEPWIHHSQKTGGAPQFVLASTKAKMVNKREDLIRVQQQQLLDIKEAKQIIKSCSPKKLISKKNQLSRNKVDSPRNDLLLQERVKVYGLMDSARRNSTRSPPHKLYEDRQEA